MPPLWEACLPAGGIVASAQGQDFWVVVVEGGGWVEERQAAWQAWKPSDSVSKEKKKKAGNDGGG